MKTFILFVYGVFDSNESIANFCDEKISSLGSVHELKYVIDNMNNLIIIFDSESDYKTLSDDLFGSLHNNNVKLYFLFEKKSLVSAHLPEELKDFIFKPTNKKMLDVEFLIPKNFDLDTILDKIEKYGLPSLTTDEKSFLDNLDI
jgi:hypothetical protein